jgi:hypothetical protein
MRHATLGDMPVSPLLWLACCVNDFGTVSPDIDPAQVIHNGHYKDTTCPGRVFRYSSIQQALPASLDCIKRAFIETSAQE